MLADLLPPTRDHARVTCPACGRGPKDRTFGITRNERGLVGHCFRCGHVATDRVQRAGSTIAAPKAPRIEEVLSPRWRAFWDDCQPLAGTAGETYLRARGCVMPPADGDLRFHPAAWHWPTRTSRPALVALLTDAVTGEARSLHFTFLRPDGACKAEIDAPRLLLPRHRKAGAVCRLWPGESVTHGLCVAEGIETALSAAAAFRPVWAAIDAGNMAVLPVLAGVECLTIAADHDDAGLRAANECARRWAAAGLEAFMVTPPTRGADLNDLVLS